MKWRHVCDVCGEELVFEKPTQDTARLWLTMQSVCIQGRHNLPDKETMYDHAEYFGPYHG